ncbi:MAG: phosphoribosyltransferase family protein [Candidatus Thorarchaeota archaeon]|jgi:phosphoribosylpyrophosphate synthetase
MMKDYDVVLASGAEHLRERFEEHGFRVFTSNLNYDSRRLFPNTDIYARLGRVSELANRKVVVIQSCTGAGPAEFERYTTSDRVLELLLLLDILAQPVEVEKIGHKKFKETSIDPPSRIEVVLTFQPFALQDKSFLTGEASAGRWATRQIAKACDKIWVVNPHAPNNLPWVKDLIEKGIYHEIDIIPDLIDFGREKFGFTDCLVVTPDEGAKQRYDIEGFGKKRTNSYCVELHGDLDVKGRQVIVIDDLTKSGSTLLKAAERLYSLGASDVGMAVAHVMPLRDRGEKLLGALIDKSKERIVTTNSVRTHAFCEDEPSLSYNIVDTLVKEL